MSEIRGGTLSTLMLSLFVLATFSGCGGGGGSGGGVGGNNINSVATTPAPIKQVFVSDKVLEPALSIGSQGTNLYVGTQYGLVEIDSITGAKRTVAGNQMYTDAVGGFVPQTTAPSAGLFDTASASVFVPLHPTNEAKMASIPLSAAVSAPPSIVVPQRAMTAMPNFRGMTANATQAFWMGFDGITTMNVYTETFGQAASLKNIASVTAADGNMATFGDYLYLYTDETGTPTRMVFRYQISTGNLVSIQQPRSVPTYNLNFPLVAASNGVYWAEGKNIYFLNNASSASNLVGSVAGNVTQLTMVGSLPYSLHWETNAATSSIVVTQFNPLTLTPTEMVRQAAGGIQAAQISGTAAGRIFLAKDVIGTGITPSEITGPNTLKPLATLPAYGLKGMYVSPSTLALVGMQTGTTNTQIYRYNLASAVSDAVTPVSAPTYMAGAGESLFFSDLSANMGIAQLQLNIPVNTPVALQPSPTVNSSWTQGGTSSGGYLYWVGYQLPVTGPVYQLETSMPNGLNFAVLLQTVGELRDPTIFNGRVYFLCKDSCGAAGWVIASTTLAGAGQRIDVIVGGINPRLYQFNGHAYLTGSDGVSSSIFAIDMNTWALTALASQIPYPTLNLDFSNKWLYWAGESVLGGGQPSREVSRQAWIDWKSIAPKQQIESGTASSVVDLRIGTLHYFSGNIYYWNNGLVRVAD